MAEVQRGRHFQISKVISTDLEASVATASHRRAPRSTVLAISANSISVEHEIA
jgi:hypothetical protein